MRPDGCHVWTGTTAGTKSRYGTFRAGTKATDPKVYVHRWVYEQKVGPIPDGMEIDHTCGQPLCVNPDHLEPVTPGENQRRRRLDACLAGHDLTDDANVRWDEKGRRRGCKVCWLARQRERYHERKRSS